MIRFKPVFTAAVCAALCLSVQAEADPGDAGVQFDFNQDGVTDEADWSQLRQFALDYAMTEDEVTNFAAQEFPATFMLLVDEWYGNRSSAPNDAEVDAIPEYYLPTVGLSTPVKDQEPFGSCWAFGTISSVESNLLRKRYGHGDTAAASALDLSGVSDEVNLSELYLAYENLQTVTSGSQAGEGATPMSNDINSHFSIGGFASTSQQILTAWDGPVTEEQEPYEPLSAEGDGANVYGLRNEDADRSGTPAAHVQTFLYLDSPSIYHVDLNRKIYAYDRYDADAVQRAKANLYQYGALMVSYSADMSMPGDTGVSKYFDYANWAQFDFSDALNMNHMVSIVGWNDSYPKENFRNEDGVMPESDGAWLVKNSWGNFDQMYASYGEALIDALEGAKGTENEILYNRYYNYGIPDAQGHGSGYFWLSYCDHSITSICAMDADDPADGYDYDHIYQYDHSIGME